jgi:hypothetical protein
MDTNCDEAEDAVLAVRFVQEGRFLVAVPEGEVPSLTVAMVEETRGALHRERLHAIVSTGPFGPE